MKKTFNRKGFTLVEMLIVIAIIAILASVALVSVSGVRQQAADTKRISDINKIQQQLEVFYSRNGNYPNATTDGGLDAIRSVVNIVDVNSVRYLYAVSGNGQHYVVGAKLANSNAIMNEPNEIDTTNLPAGVTDPGCADANPTFGYCIGN